MSKFLEALRERVLLCDGGTGSRVQAMTLDIERDYLGKENCTEVLVKSRPDIVRSIHRSYLEAGADCVQTNTFGGSPITLGEFGLEDEAHWINKRAAEIARETLEEFSGDGRVRFVIGSIGP
ncbi:MAG: methionine synthase, partial [Alphaproteobacteria bacterium]|nr:methionine synthase [Alphaproteobacteria bacterium]